MATHPRINDPDAREVLFKIGEEGLLAVGSLLRAWEEGGAKDREDREDREDLEPKSPQPSHDQEFVDGTRLELALASDEIKALRKDLETSREESLGLRRDVDETRKILEDSLESMKRMREEVEDSKEEIESLLKVNKDIYERLESADSGKRSSHPDPDWFSKKMKIVEDVR